MTGDDRSQPTNVGHHGEDRVNPEDNQSGRSQLSAHACNDTGGERSLWEKVFSRRNLFAALERVETNRGAPGVDGLTTQELRSWLVDHWVDIRSCLDAGTYKPMPVRQVPIPKPDGGQRLLGVPTVLDRLIQQALAQVLTPVFDPGFVPVSYGFRPGKSAHMAVNVARALVNQGYVWVVEVDLEKFFDRVHHDKLMARVARKVDDKRVLKLIRAYLMAGIMIDGVVSRSGEGTPQGSPLSPLLSNIMLDDFGQELWAKGTRFVRYADDIRVFVKSKRAAGRALDQASKVLEGKLKLKVNRDKSTIAHAMKAQLLGYAFYPSREGYKLRVAGSAVARLKQRLRELTSRRWGVDMDYRIDRINRYVRGWMGYFQLAATPGVFKRLDEWLRRRMRQILWKQWKTPQARRRNLRCLGLSEYQIGKATLSARSYWAVAKTPTLHKALGTAYWVNRGLLMLFTAWNRRQITVM
ncbi:group II intron reverse transcriptase/maturase [uncultured Corynebacterium sp.]|uniref:group II intron reverse transcriptase/maturase n=1 Tax=uncultured Corynebacterium sp. TaxID=159447 RepID=UPI0025E86EA0|nr:group II intron reverse transcriptase/maturase [uncultured Corynebacterium sp.]